MFRILRACQGSVLLSRDGGINAPTAMVRIHKRKMLYMVIKVMSQYVKTHRPIKLLSVGFVVAGEDLYKPYEGAVIT